MAYKGQIMTVSDVLINGTVDEYILGADANIFQTNYDSNGAVANWRIGDSNNYLEYNGLNIQMQAGIDNNTFSWFRFDENALLLATNYHYNSIENKPCYLVVGNADGENHAILGYWEGSTSFDPNVGVLLIKPSKSFLYGKEVHCKAASNCYIGTTCADNQICWGLNDRPYFGSNASNYVLGKSDINDMATKTWCNSSFSESGHNHDNRYALKIHYHNDEYYTKSYIDSNYYTRTQLSDLYQTKLPQTGSTFDINISGTAYSASLATEATGASGTNFATHAEANYGPSLAYCIGRLDSRGLEIVGANNIGTFMVEYYYSSTRGRYEFKYGNGNNPLRLEGSVLTANDSINVTSDITLKDNIQTFGQEEEQFYLSLKPCKYHLKKNKKDNFSYGFIAQEVQQSEKDNLSYDTDFIDGEKILSLNYNNFISLSTYMVQKQHQEIETLKAEIAEIKELLKNK